MCHRLCALTWECDYVAACTSKYTPPLQTCKKFAILATYMSKLSDASDGSADGDHVSLPDSSPHILTTMADTTWRMFVPTIGLLLVGRWLDRQWNTHPWLMLVGATIGACIAALLIKRQLTRG